jgi:hypothetical protein
MQKVLLVQVRMLAFRLLGQLVFQVLRFLELQPIEARLFLFNFFDRYKSAIRVKIKNQVDLPMCSVCFVCLFCWARSQVRLVWPFINHKINEINENTERGKMIWDFFISCSDDFEAVSSCAGCSDEPYFSFELGVVSVDLKTSFKRSDFAELLFGSFEL